MPRRESKLNLKRRVGSSRFGVVSKGVLHLAVKRKMCDKRDLLLYHRLLGSANKQ